MTYPPAEFIDQRALTLALDMAVLLDESKKKQGTELGSALARSAITNATLLLECIANSCLFSLALPTRLLDELDKLPPIAKLDYYLFSRRNTHIDRGCRETELAVDVLKLRDHIVHPKPKPGTTAEASGVLYIDYGATKALQIPLDSREWTHEDGLKVANALTNFLSQFFLVWAKQTIGQVTTLLAARERLLVQHGHVGWVQIPEGEYLLVKQWLPKILEFIDLRAQIDHE